MVSSHKKFPMKNVNKISDPLNLTPEFKKENKGGDILRFLLLLALILLLSLVLSLYFKRSIYRYCPIDIDDYFQNAVCSSIPNEKKFDCYPDAPVTENECINRGCCYSVPKSNLSSSLPPLNVPYCYYPSDYRGYVVKNIVQTPRRIQAKLQKVKPSGFPKDVNNLNLLITFIDNCIVRLKITDADSQRYEVPIQLQYQTKEITEPCYDVKIDPKSGLLQVKRKSTGSVLFSSDLSRLVFSDQFLQLSSDLPSSYFYGVGEHYGKLLRSTNWTRFTLINSDLPPVPNHGLYGSHPFYMVLENDGKASGVFLFNSNIMDIILQPTPAVTFRPIGGIFDFFIMLGPSPNDVTRQYSSIVGKTFMPPFWSLGFQLCRFGYKTLNKTREVMQRNIDAGIPVEVQWNDIDYMDDYKDFTYDKKNFAGLPEFVNDLHADGRRYVIMTDPGLSNSEQVYPPYDEGVDDDIFVKNANGSIFVGKVWTSGTTVFPDFSHPAAVPFWTRQFRRFYDEVKFDGVWIDMNEPSNFWNGGSDGCPDSPLENPQYVPGGNALRTKTVCMSAKHYNSAHYNEHNIYGYREAVATNHALRSVRRKRPFIISRATFPGQGVYSGHWSGDVYSTWEDMRYTIPSMINFNMYGIPMVGSDICGFNGNTTVELCARWQSLGAFYPFARNHNERVTIEQDPVALGPTVVEATKTSLGKRYTLLPYLYTLFYRSHVFGETIVRPLFFEFPEDANTFSIDEQFMWGSSVMIVPSLYTNATTVSAYFPKGVWYDETGKQKKSSGEKVNLKIPVTDISLTFRGGVIFLAKEPEMTTDAMRNTSYIVGIALDEQQKAHGELYWDDGDSLETYENGLYNLIKFESTSDKLNSTILNDGFKTEMTTFLIQVLGLNSFPKQVTLNGNECKPRSLNSLKNSTASDENLGTNSFRFLRHNVKQFEELSVEVETCQFYQSGYFLTIQTVPVSLLSPLLVTWK